MEAKLPDARPLINVCGSLLVLLQILPTTMYANNRYIEGYDQNVNPGNAPLVVVQLLDDECPEDFIKGLTLSVRSLLPEDLLLEQYEERYVVERMDPELWEKVLSPDNEFRRQLIDQVVSTSLPESKSPEQVSAAVKAIKADPSRVMVINRLDNFDGPAVGDVAVKAALYDEAFVAKVQLCEGLVSDAIESFIRAEDATQFLDDIWASEDANVYHDLVRLDDIKEFILMPNVASLPNVGDRLCDEASKVDELEEVSDYYQNRGCFNELISFMESGLVLERAHMAIFTDHTWLLCNNASAVNEALNEIYVDEEDSDRLRESIDLHDNFDQIGLGQKVK
ncbi:hypothetical protein H6P81_002354 [Aristolochia fimbriata]|uniref:Uncharacterized protein n=1 Tax=Aristolochia fimbriata TaxID=158543 RepID=A0AAV7FDD4_ARIFI|nr:hypothetical protein H6P81_002354 [Aristolochia fimbriata]